MMIFGHRGGKVFWPENAISTIEQSVQHGVYGVELDIRTTMDDRPVIMHDATVDRTTQSTGEVCKMNEDVVLRLKLAENESETVPSLLRVLETFRKRDVVFLLELKHPSTALPTAELVDHFMKSKGLGQGRVIIISFYHQLIALIKDKYPKILTGASLREIPESLAACGEYTNSHYVLPPIDQLDRAFMDDAEQRNLRVIPWLCDSAEQLEKARELHVYGIITSDPKAAMKS